MQIGIRSKACVVVATVAMLAACAQHDGGGSSTNGSRPAPVQPDQPDHGVQVGDVVVKSVFQMYVSSANFSAMGGNPVTIPISVINAPNSEMTINTSKFTVPTITNAPLSFGELSISGLMDNNLNVCGKDGKTKCTTAVIRIYTVGPNAGFYNSDIADSRDITANLSTSKPLNVGVGVGGAAVVQTIPIGASKHVFRLSDFVTTPAYKINSDFTEAGAGTYATTLVIEYGLSL